MHPGIENVLRSDFSILKSVFKHFIFIFLDFPTVISHLILFKKITSLVSYIIITQELEWVFLDWKFYFVIW